MAKEHINPDTLFPSVAHGFSQVIATRGGKTIYISGQTAWDAEKRLVGGNSLEAQAKQAFQNVRHAVEAAGGSLADVVALRLYVVNYRLQTQTRLEAYSGNSFLVSTRPRVPGLGCLRWPSQTF